MKHIIIGTAGHIDHGKTTLIKALTGRETDTLREEKERGISINLGFTFFDLPSGKRAGIVDVPGHERFIKNMLAGVSGIDIVLLVIAADEGIMPQTREHLEILQLLAVKKGIVVLTKMDMVEEEWLEMITEEVREGLMGTFLEAAPIVPVSSKSGENLKELIRIIDEATEEVEEKDEGGHFRLPVDRVFSITGFGTVVTGTIISGSVREGDTVEIYPSGIKAKVRGLQVHEKPAEIGEAGQRCAINLSGVKVEDIERGDVLAENDSLQASLMVDANMYYLKSAGRPLENRQRVRLYHGTSEILCRVVLLDKEELEPGENAYVQLRLEAPLTAQRKDRFVIRSYSPMHTIGGGVILEPKASKGKRFNEQYIKEIKLKETGETENILETSIKRLSSEFPGEDSIIKSLGKKEEGFEDMLKQLVEQGRVIKFMSQEKPVYTHKSFFQKKGEEIERLLSDFHKENPLKAGMSKEEVRSRIFGKSVKPKLYEEIIKLYDAMGRFRVEESNLALMDFEVSFTEEQKRIKDYIADIFKKGGFTTPRFEEIAEKEKNKKELKRVFDALVDSGELVKVVEGYYLCRGTYEKGKTLIVDFIKEKGSLTAAEARDLLNTSRKYAVSFIEHLDMIKITKRIEDKRVLY